MGSRYDISRPYSPVLLDMTPAHSSDPNPPGWPPWYRRFVLPYLNRSALWPVLIAILGHIWVVLGLLLLRLARRGDALSWVVLLGLLLASVWAISFEVQCTRRPGGLTAVVISTWLLSAGLAWVSHHYGVL